MKKFFSFITVILIISFFGCSSDSSTGPDDETPTGDVLVTETIGQSGGTVTADNISISIPSNSFSSSSQLKISTVDATPFEGARVSSSFKIEGIPADYSKPLKLVLSKTGSGQGTAYMAVGSETFAKSLNSSYVAYKMFPARDSSGYLVIDLPIRDGSFAKMGRGINSSSLTLQVEAVNATQTTSTSSHFKILHSNTYSSQAASLAGYLEEAYIDYKNMGFVFSISDPVEVNILDLGAEHYGQYTYNLWGDWLEFNSRKINNSSELRITAGHEFFHWVQMRYDNRMWASKVLSSGDRLWFEEATAVWAESKFTSATNYVSDARSGFEMQPFYGMQAGASGDAQGHGYGMSAFVKYLTMRYGENIVKNIFDQLKIGLKPMDAIQNKTSDPSDYWCADFFANYAMGNIYPDISTAQIIGDVQTSEWTVTSPSDTLKTFDFTSYDLSAKFFQIKLVNELFTEEAVMNFSLTAPDYCAIYLFAYKGIELTYLGGAEGELSLPELKGIKDSGYHILAMVVNSNIVTPFTNYTSANLTVRVAQPMYDFFSCQRASIYVKTYRKMALGDGSTAWGMGQISIHNVNSGSAVGTWDGNTFTANFTYPEPGSMSITVNPVTGEVISFSGSKIPAINCSVSVAGHNIPYTENSAFASPPSDAVATMHNVIGMDVCDHLTTFYSLQDWANRMEVVDFSCNSESFVQIMFYSELP